MSDEIYFDGVRFVRLDEAAKNAGLSPYYLLNFARSGKILFREVSGRKYIGEDSLKVFLESRIKAKEDKRKSLSKERAQEYTVRNTKLELSPDVISERFVTVKAASNEVGLSIVYLHRLAKDGTIATATVGKQTLLDRNSLHAFLLERAHKAEEKKIRLKKEREAEYAQKKTPSRVSSVIRPTAQPSITSKLKEVSLPVHGVTSWREVVEKTIALTLAVTLTFSVYALIDPSYARFALSSAADSVKGIEASYEAATHGGIQHLAELAQSKLKYTAENPSQSLASAASFFPDKAAALARFVNSGIDRFVYAVAFPNSLTSHSGGSVAVEIAPYAAPGTGAAPAHTPAAPTPALASNSTPQTIINNPVVERIIERAVPQKTVIQAGGITEDYLNTKLNQLENKLSSRMYGLTAANSTSIVQNYVVAGEASRNDYLENSIIKNAKITGGSLADVSISASGLTVSGATTLESATVNGDLSLGGNLTVTGTSSVFSVQNATLTNATSTNFFATTASSTNFFASAASFGTLNLSGLGIFANGFLSQASSTVGDGSQAGGLVVYGGATTTGNSLVQGSLTIADASVGNTGALYFGSSTASLKYNSSDYMFYGGSVYTAAGRIVAQALNETTGLGVRFASGNGTYFLGATTGLTPDLVFTNNGNLERARLTDSGNFGIGTSSPTSKLEVAGDTFLGGNLTATGTLSVSGDTLLGNATTSRFFASIASSTNLSAAIFNTGFATFGNATSTNFFASIASSTNLYANTAIFGSTTVQALTVGGGISSSGGLSVNGNGYFSGGLGIGVATTTPGALQTSGDAAIGGNLYVGGNSIVLGNSSANTLVVNSAVSSSFIPSSNKTYDLGSPSFFWRNGYLDTLTVNNISAASSSIGGTASNSLTINSDNATADTEDMSLIFFRGVVVPNAVFSWNSALGAKRFEFNQAAYISNQSGSTTQPTLTLKGAAGQTGNIFQIASSTGTNIFTVAADGSVTISTSTITALSSGTTTMTNLSVTNTSTSTFAGPVTFGSNLLNIISTGQIAIGAATATSSALVQLDSTTRGFLPPRMTTAQKNAIVSPSFGLVVYDTDLNKLNVYNGSVWKNVGSTELAGEVTNGTANSVLFVDNGTSGPVLAQDNANFNFASSTHTLSLAKLSLTAGTSTNFFATTASSTNLFAATASFGALTVTNTITGSVSGNAGTATALQNARTINGISFNGTANIVVASTTLLANNNTWTGLNSFSNASSSLTTFSGSTWFTGLTASAILALDANGKTYSTATSTLSIGGNAGTATALQNARLINGVSFNGTADITVASTTLLANNNTFSGNNVFSASTTINAQLNLQQATTTNFTHTGSTWFTALTSALLSTDSNGKLVASSTPTAQNFLATSATAASQFPYASSTALSVSGTAFIGSQGLIETPSIAGCCTGLKVQSQTTNARTLLSLVPNGSSVLADLWLFNSSDVNTNYGRFGIGYNSSFGQWSYFTDKANSGTAAPIALQAFSGTNGGTAALSQLVLATSGNVGVGTTTPFTRFSVGGDAYIGGNLTATGTLNVSGNTTLAFATSTTFFATTASSTNLFATTASLGTVTTSGLTANGNTSLAFATSTNFFATTASSTNLFAATARFGAFVSTSGQVAGELKASQFTDNDNSTYYLNPDNSALSLIVAGNLQIGAGGGTALVLSGAGTSYLNGGNVGIGTTSPFSKFSVGGDSYFGGNLTATGTLTVSGNTSLTSATSTNFFATTASSTNLFAAAASFGALSISGAFTQTGLATFANGFVSQASSTVVGNFTTTGFLNTTGTAGGYKMDGNLVLYASTTNSSLFGGQSGGSWASASSTQIRNTAFGYLALGSNGSPVGLLTDNTAVGQKALYSLTSGIENTAVGSEALTSLTIGSANVALGRGALVNTTSGGDNVGIGRYAFEQNRTGTNNVGIGSKALDASISGSANVAIGLSSSVNNSSATNTVAIGNCAAAGGASANCGSGQTGFAAQGYTVVGYRAGLSFLTGADFNTLLGYQAGGLITAGSKNIYLGAYTTAANANITTGSNNIIIGNDVQAPLAGGSNQLNIGNLIFGTGLSGTGSSVSTGNIGIGTTTPGYTLSVVGNADFGSSVSTSRHSTFDTSGGLNMLYSDNSSRTNITFQNFGITGTNQGNNLLWQMSSTSATALSAARIAVNTESTYLTDSAAGMQFQTGLNGALNTAMAITSSRNVGLSTSTPWGRLSVVGAGLTTGYTFMVVNNNNTPIFNIQDNGNVGIGTSSPTSKLEVAGNTFLGGNLTATGTLTVAGDTTLANATSTNLFSTTASSTNLFAQSASVGSLTTSGLTANGNTSLTFATSTSFFATTASSTNLFAAAATFGSLTISGATTHTGLTTFANGFLSNASSTVTSGLFSMNGGASTTNFTASGTGFFGLGNFTSTTGTTTIASGQGFTIGGSQFVLQQGSGNVGIGTSTPTSNLFITSPSQQNGTAPLLTVASTTGTPMFSVLSSGFVGLGTTAPVAQLHVAGLASSSIAVGAMNVNAAPGIAQSNAFALQGKYIYYVGNSAVSNNFQIFDVSTPSSPSSTGNVTMTNAASAVAVQGPYAYVGESNVASNRDIEIVDVSNPKLPFIVGAASTTATVSSVQVQGRYLYAVEASNATAVEIFDIGNPVLPVLVGTTTTSSNTCSGGACTGFVQGKYLYVTSGSSIFNVIDVSNPSKPSLVSNINVTGNEQSIYVQGRYAYTAATASTNGFNIIDISNPAVPVKVGQTDLYNSGQSGSGVYVQGRYAYVAMTGNSSVQIIDVSSSTVPVTVGAFTVTANQPKGGIIVQGRYAYVTTNSTTKGIQIFDIGGAYIQQLETGGLETGTLSISSLLTAYGKVNFVDSLSVGRGLNVTGPFALTAPTFNATSSATQMSSIFTLGSPSSTVPYFTTLYNGSIGIGTSSPTGLLALHANSGTNYAGNLLFNIASSTANSTTTLFSISNQGLVTGLDFSLRNGTTTSFFATTASSTNLFASAATFGSLTIAGTLSSGATSTATYFAASSLGSAGAPAFTFSSDLDSGMWQPVTNQLAFSSAGSEALRFDGSQRLLVGATTSRVAGAGAARVQFEGLSSTSGGGMSIITNNNTNAAAALLTLGASGSNAIGSVTSVGNAHNLGIIDFAGADGTDLSSIAARILATSDATPSTGIVPGRLTFHTTDSAGVLNERMRITSAGLFGFGTTSPTGKFAIQLNSTDAAYPGNLAFNIASSTATATTTLFAVSNAGSVGIGAAPSSGYGLEITNGGGQLLQLSRVATGVSRINLTGGLGVPVDSGTLNFTSTNAVASQGFLFDTRNSSNASVDALYINNSGNVGIGTTTPLAALSVNGQSANYQSTIFNVSSTTAAAGTVSLFNVLASGNVGIGTTTPASILAVSGGASIGADYNTAAPANGLIVEGSVGIGVSSLVGLNYGGKSLQMLGTGGVEIHLADTGSGGTSADFAYVDATGLISQTNNNRGIYLLSGSKNVAIGTTTPITTYSTNLTVSQVDSNLNKNSGINVQGTATTSNSIFAALDFWNGPNRATAIQGFNNGANNTSGLNFLTSNAGTVNTTAMTILGSGNVGIGTTTPNGKLVINATTGSGAFLRISNVGNGDGIYSDNGAVSGTFRLVRDDLVSAGGFAIGATGGIGFKTNDASYATAPSSYGMYLDTSGNLGIGTTTPARKLVVADSQVNATVGMLLENSAVTGTNGWLLGQSCPSGCSGMGAFFIQDNTHGTVPFYISSTTPNYIGISTTTPWANLSVSSPSQQSGNLALFGVASTTGADLFRVLGNGNVGIGTSTPSSGLSVIQDNVGNVIQPLFTVGSSTQQMLALTSSGQLNIGTGPFSNIGAGGLRTGSDIIAGGSFKTGNYFMGGNNANRLYLDDTYQGSGTAGTATFSNTATTDFKMLRFGGNTSAFVGLGVTNTSKALYVGLADGSLGGSFGVGTSTPTGKFAIHLNAGETYGGNYALNIASSTGTATSSLFTIDNQGNINAPATGATSTLSGVFVAGSGTSAMTFRNDNLLVGSASPISLSYRGNAIVDNGVGYKASTFLNPSGNRGYVMQLADQAGGNLGIGNFLGALSFTNTSGGAGATPVESATIYGFSDTAGSNGGMAFFTAATGGTATEAMRINSSQFVGIGTSTPDAQLSISGTGQQTQSLNTAGALGGMLYLNDVNTSTNSGGALVFGGASFKFAAIKGLLTNGVNNGQGDIEFLTRPASTDSTLTNALMIKGSGFIGIGTTTPGSILSINGVANFVANATSSIYGALQTQNIIPGGTITNNLSGYDLGATASRWNALWAGTVNVGTSTFSFKSDANSSLGFYTAASGGGTQAMTLTSTGNLGVGTTSPFAMLSLSNTSLTGTILAAYGVSTSTNPVTRIYYASSTWTKPLNLDHIVVEAWGGGGGGAGGGAGNASIGGTGATSTFTYNSGGTTISAGGGAGGKANGAGGGGGNGGPASGGDVNTTGTNGTTRSGSTAGAGANAIASTVGSSAVGTGGTGATGSGTPGAGGTGGPGAGGGGGGDTQAGGGGGGGGYAEKTLTAAQLGTTETVLVGGGGGGSGGIGGSSGSGGNGSTSGGSAGGSSSPFGGGGGFQGAAGGAGAGAGGSPSDVGANAGGNVGTNGVRGGGGGGQGGSGAGGAAGGAVVITEYYSNTGTPGLHLINTTSGPYLGVGTSTPGSLFAVQGVANFTTATSTFYSTGGINLTNGCFAIAGSCVSLGGGQALAAFSTSTVGTTTVQFSGTANTAPSFNSSTGVLTLPSNTSYITVEVWGGGGGGGGANNAGTASSGGTTCFGTSATACSTPTLSASGGGGGAGNGAGGTGGAGSGGDVNLSGSGGGGGGATLTNTYLPGGAGGVSPLGGGGGSTAYSGNSNGNPFGGGGSGGGVSNNAAQAPSGSGGGGGGYSSKLITGLAGSYTFTVGAGGAGTSNNATGGSNGGNGGAGGVVIKIYSTNSGTSLSNGQSQSPTNTSLTSGSGTYTVPPGVSYIKVRMAGGGGGGGGTGNTTGPTGGTGGTTSFGSFTAVGGTGGTGATAGTPGSGGAGGTGGSGSATLRISGQAGGSGLFPVASGMTGSGEGGSTPGFGGGGPTRGGSAVSNGVSAVANTGSGGSGAESPNFTAPAGGGGSGEYVEILITSPSASYSYSVGTSGSGGVGTGTGAATGGAGAAGTIVIDEYYGSAQSGVIGSGTTGQFAFYNAAGTTLSATSSLFLAPSGNFGIGTTSPFAKLSIHANTGETNLTLLEIASSTGAATTSLFRIGNQGEVTINGVNSASGRGLNVSISSTLFNIDSTGMNISRTGTSNGSQFAVNGSTNSTSAGSQTGLLISTNINVAGAGTYSALKINPTITQTATGGSFLISAFEGASSTKGLFLTTNHFLGLGTSTPMAQFAIQANNGTNYPGNNLFLIASSTASATSTLFVVNNQGSVGVGTTTASGAVSISSSGSTVGTLIANTTANSYTQSEFQGTGRDYHIGVGNASETLYGVANKFFLYDQNANAMRLTIDSSGNLGIGTTTPYSRLTVWGNGTNSLFEAVDSASSTKFIITNAGNVGIGTTNPAFKLDVQNSSTVASINVSGVGTNYVDAALILDGNSNANGRGEGVYMHDTLGGKEWFAGRPYTNSSGGSDAFVINREVYAAHDYQTAERMTNGATMFYVDNTGRVGIGTTTPNSKLSLENTGTGGTVSELSLSTVQGGVGDGSAIDFYAGAYNKNARIYSYAINSNAGQLRFATANGAGFVDQMTVSNTGNVGIGTTTPFLKFTVGTGDGTQRDVGVFNGAICADNGGSAKCYGALTAGVVYGDSSSFVASDVAENYPTKDHSIVAGEIVSLDNSATTTVKRAVYGDAVFGIVSTAPGVLLGDEATSSVSVALTGRVPVKVSLENGPIQVGDSLSLSSTPGVAKKAVVGEATIGIALDNYLFAVPNSSILAFVRAGNEFNYAELTKLLATTSVAEMINGTGSSTAPWVASFADASQSLKNELLALGDVVVHIVAKTMYASTGIFEKVFAKEVDTDKLCVTDTQGKTCITRAQLDALIAGAAQGSGNGSSNNNGSSNGGGATSTPDTEAPVISIIGTNPASINVGDTYSDLGATVTDNVSTNLGISVSVDGGATTTIDSISINTSSAGSHSILYSATDEAGNTGTATRTVEVH